MKRLEAEFIGTFFLVLAGTGSAIMRLQNSPDASYLGLIGGALSVGAVLYVFITLYAAISGAHFNPAVSFVFFLRKELSAHFFLGYCLAQVTGGILAILSAHALFGLDWWQPAPFMPASLASGFSEGLATFGLILVILTAASQRLEQIPILVAAFVVAGYLMTPTSIVANPAVTIARMLSQSPTSIGGARALLFLISQFGAALLAAYIFGRNSQRLF